MSLYLFYTTVQKSQKWPKTQIKGGGGSCLKKAFFVIAVRPEARVYLRVVWPNQDGELVTWRLKRVPFGINCSPFLLNATICHHLQLEKQNKASDEVRKIVELIQDSFYVDDCLSVYQSDSRSASFTWPNRVR